MQEEINHKTITVYIKGARVTANSLKAALRAVLRAREKHKKNVQRQEAAYQEEDVAVNRGKQSLRDLQDEGSELSNIEITDENIKSFERYARKYGIDYALKKDLMFSSVISMLESSLPSVCKSRRDCLPLLTATSSS